MRVYFDNAATTPLHPEVISEMQSAMSLLFGNPSSIHAEGRKVRAAIEDARKRVAKNLGASIGEIFFTSGGTEANNMAIKGAVRDLGVTRIITSPIEHHCGLHTFDNVKAFHGTTVEYLKVDNEGNIDLSELQILLSNSAEKTLVSLMFANNEIGTLHDIQTIGEICEQYQAYLHTDTVQAIGHFPIDLNHLKIHFLSGAAHKFHGPKGVGFIYINSEVKLVPFIDGGSQERNMRGGTENVYGIIGLAKALDLAYDSMASHYDKINELRHYFKTQLIQHFEDIEFNGNQDEGKYLYTVLSASFPPSPKSDLLLLSLDIAGVSASGGSACSSGADAGSHVIAAIHPDSLRTTIRFSFSSFNTKEEVDFVIKKLVEILKSA
jgi:cysteine desulfurase